MPRRFVLSFVAMTLSLLVSAGLGNAATTLTLNYKAFPSNGNLLNVGTFNVDGAVKLSAPENFYDKGVTYEFLFWDLNGSRNIHRDVDFTPPSDPTALATAWYLPTGGGPCPKGQVCDGVTTWAFSLNDDKVIPNTPIASVTPKGAWTGAPSTSVNTNLGAVVIAAQPLIPGFGKFKSWLELPNTAVKGNDLDVGAKGSAAAVAFYGFPEPDPCQSLRNQVAICDTQNGTGCGPLWREQIRALQACEQKYGEIAAP
jgi:hypothetical protein